MTVPEGSQSRWSLPNPVAMTFDERGRAWITESHEGPRRNSVVYAVWVHHEEIWARRRCHQQIERNPSPFGDYETAIGVAKRRQTCVGHDKSQSVVLRVRLLFSC